MQNDLDLTSVKTITDIAQKFGFSFKKGFGQNFLTNPDALISICDSAEIKDGVIEIGPGFGVLTKELAKTGKKVVSFEVDKTLLPVLDYTLSEFDNVKIINEDIMKVDLQKVIENEFANGEVSVAANLPYYITTPIITHLLESRLPIKSMVFMVQKEVAERIAAKKGRQSGAITIMAQYYSEPKLVQIVPAGDFYPSPKVDSAVLKLTMLNRPRVEVSDEKVFFKTVRASFAQRRKTLANGLASGLGIDKAVINDMLEDLGYSKTVRGEALKIEDFARISDEIYNILQKNK